MKIRQTRKMNLRATDGSRARKDLEKWKNRNDLKPQEPIRWANMGQVWIEGFLIPLGILKRDGTFGSRAQVGPVQLEKSGAVFLSYFVEISYQFDLAELRGPKQIPVEKIPEGGCINCGGSTGVYDIAAPYWCLRCAEIAAFVNMADSVSQMVMWGNSNIIGVRAPSPKEQKLAFIHERAAHLVENARSIEDAERFANRGAVAEFLTCLTSE